MAQERWTNKKIKGTQHWMRREQLTGEKQEDKCKKWAEDCLTDERQWESSTQ
jgi:hypothetical protein